MRDVGWGREGRDPRQKMTRRVRVKGEGRWKKGRWIFAAQCQDPKDNNPVFLLLPSEWGSFALSRKMVDGACLAAAASLAWLQKCFPLHSSGQRTREKNKQNARPLNVTCRTRVDLNSYNQRGLTCPGCSAGLQGRRGKQGVIVVIFFFPEKSHRVLNLSAKEM